MSVTDVAVQEAAPQSRTERIVNDFSLQIATVNGSGSQTANLVLLRSIFQMGVPVSGKKVGLSVTELSSVMTTPRTWASVVRTAPSTCGTHRSV